MAIRTSGPLLVAERTMPLLLGLCATGLYYRLCKTQVKGAALKAHVIGLGISSFSGAHRTGKKRLDQVIFFSPLIIAASILSFKKFRQNAFYFGGWAVTQMMGMHLLANTMIHRKKRPFTWDPNSILFKEKDNVKNALEKLESLLQRFAYNKDRQSVEGIVDDFKAKTCEIFSLDPTLWDEAERMGKSISDPQKRVAALTTLGRNDPERVEALLDYCRPYAQTPEELEILEFEVKKKTPKFHQIIIPPKSLDRTRLSREEWAQIQNTFTTVFALSSKQISFEKQALVVTTRDDAQHRYALPYAIKHLFQNNRTLGIILIPKVTIGKGAQRKVKLAYNLTTGTFYAKKQLGRLEGVALRAVTSPPNRGLPRVSISSTQGETTKIYQPLFSHTMAQAVQGRLLDSRQAKLTVIRRILEAVRNFHQHTIDELTYTPPKSFFSSIFPQKDPDPIDISQFPAMHGDLKTQNIVINDKTLEVMLIDLGVSCLITGVSGTLLYLDPATAKHFKAEPKRQVPFQSQHNAKPVIDYHREYGQTRDVWAAALVITGILLGVNERGRPKFSPIQECALMQEHERRFHSDEELVARNILNLKQETVDRSLDGIEGGKDPLIPLLKKMLKVAPAERIDSEAALREFDLLV